MRKWGVAVSDRVRLSRRLGWLDPGQVAATAAALTRWGPSLAALYAAARGRRVAIKNLIMNAKVVVGVGNIYASESLFLAGINPKRSAGRIARHRYDALADAIKDVLGRAIRAGGTTLRDFYGGDGEPGYFRQQLEVYDRDGEHCRCCNTII